MSPRVYAFCATFLAALACGDAIPQTPTIAPMATPVPTATVAPTPTFPSTPVFVSGKTRTLQVDGLDRSFILNVPPSYTPDQPWPLVLVFHGGAGKAARMDYISGFQAESDRSGFILAYPNGTGRVENVFTWNAGLCCGYAFEENIDDVNFIRVLIEALSKEFNLDTKRIYAAGLSNGAMLSYRLACELSDQIAAIGPVAATQNISQCNPNQPVSVIHFHGTDDQYAPYNGGPGPEALLTDTDHASVKDSIQFWIEQDNCASEPKTESFGTITHEVYASCDQDTAVELYTIEGGGHAWPGGKPYRPNADKPTQEISATALIWQFFAAHPRP